VDHRNGRALELTLERPVRVDELTVKLFADGADVAAIRTLYENPLIQGFTTNPTLMRKAGITDYERFAHELLEAVPDRPISFEVFSDEPAEMEQQALKLASWGEHVYVKIPVTNTRGERTEQLLRRLVESGVKVNVTGILTLEQVDWVSECVTGDVGTYVSVFAGRIADTGVDPLPIMSAALQLVSDRPGIELIWASPRELFNVVQADRIGCHIITVTHDVLKKLPILGRPLEQLSLETVKMFHEDAVAAGYGL
jgi:transaldolase